MVSILIKVDELIEVNDFVRGFSFQVNELIDVVGTTNRSSSSMLIKVNNVRLVLLFLFLS